MLLRSCIDHTDTRSGEWVNAGAGALRPSKSRSSLPATSECRCSTSGSQLQRTMLRLSHAMMALKFVPQQRFKIMYGVACGMAWLHNKKPLPIVHRDLKARAYLWRGCVCVWVCQKPVTLCALCTTCSASSMLLAGAHCCRWILVIYGVGMIQ
jgi:hypothetical protein